MMENPINYAPGAPGITPHWTSSAKVGVGTSLSPESRVWFTLSHGIFNEIYYPRVDQACTRDLGLIVTDGQDWFSEEKRDADHEVSFLAEGVPAYRLVNTCRQGRYRLEKEILSDPRRDVVLQKTRFVPLKGSLSDYHLYALLAPHLGNQGMGNTAWVGEYKGVPMLMAQQGSNALALACSVPWLNRSAGFVGTSDSWQDLSQHKCMTWRYDRAEDGNVALGGEIDLLAGDGNPGSGSDFVLALGFGRNPAEAGQRALASLLDGFEVAQDAYIREWQGWQKKLHSLQVEGAEPCPQDLCQVSTAVLRTHEAKRFPGGLIASLAIPWGFAKGDDDLGGYHLVWPRDLGEAAGGLLAIGAHEDARRVINYLRVTQEKDGHWPQNMWLDGRTYWSGIQMDETAFPILLVDLAYREKALGKDDITRLWPMLRSAAGFLVRNGPVTQEDRWEEDPGYSPFTLAVEIAALLAVADMAEMNGEEAVAGYVRETADAWNDSIERWTYVTGTDLARDNGVEGYYVRISPADVSDAASPTGGYVPIKNRPPGQSTEPAAQLISPDALALVRFGLRDANDPRMVNTVKVIDALLKVDTPFGPAWHRYNDDGYGEHEDGSPFDGTGVGRAWPLLTGERAHYELAAGRRDDALRLLAALEAFANEGSLISEQVWDAEDIPEAELFCGRPSGSAMPLVWAHAEYIKLRRSLHDGHLFDRPSHPLERYVQNHTKSAYTLWRFNQKCQSFPAGKVLRIEVPAPATVRWSSDGWQTYQDNQTHDSGLGMYIVDLPTRDMKTGAALAFTFYWPDQDRWEGTNYQVRIE
jgi:glucoamylase